MQIPNVMIWRKFISTPLKAFADILNIGRWSNLTIYYMEIGAKYASRLAVWRPVVTDDTNITQCQSHAKSPG